MGQERFLSRTGESEEARRQGDGIFGALPKCLFRAVLANRQVARKIGNAGRVRAWRALGAEISPEAFIAADARLRQFLERIRIEEGSLVGEGVELHAWGEIRIGRRVLVSQGARILTGTHNYNSPAFEGEARGVAIGDYAWIGAYAIILPGVQIGEAAAVGAGAVVSQDVPPYAIVAGNPARVVGQREQANFTYIPAQFP